MTELDFFKKYRKKDNVESENIINRTPILGKHDSRQFMVNRNMSPISGKKKKKKNDDDDSDKSSGKHKEEFTNAGNGSIDSNSIIMAIIGAIIMTLISTQVVISLISKFVTGMYDTKEEKFGNSDNIMYIKSSSNISFKGKMVLAVVFLVLFIGIDIFVIKNNIKI